MSYVKITDLQELLAENIEGDEYLFVTNAQSESNKMRLDSLIDKISSNVHNSISSDVHDIVISEIDDKVQELTSMINSTNEEIESIKADIYEHINTQVETIMEAISKIEHITTDKIQIIDNKITLLRKCKGMPIFNSSMIYDTLSSEYYTEYSCSSSNNGLYILFNELDGLNGKFAVVSYLAGDTV